MPQVIRNSKTWMPGYAAAYGIVSGNNGSDQNVDYVPSGNWVSSKAGHVVLLIPEREAGRLLAVRLWVQRSQKIAFANEDIPPFLAYFLKAKSGKKSEAKT